jgi:uncharacterized protein YjbI with pentapeptide repeats
MDRRCCGARCLGLLTAAVAAALAAPQAASANTIQAADLAKDLGKRKTITAPAETTIQGTLDLTDVRVVQAAFECRRCTFRGDILARHVIFDREIDLGGVTIDGDLDLRGATFTKAVQLGNGAKVNGAVDLEGATFFGLVDVGKAEFVKRVMLQLTRFRDDAIFTGATFDRAVDFDGAAFDGRARFDGTVFQAETSFTRALFGAGTAFGKATFQGPVRFTGADFHSATSFNSTTFYGLADFEEARFAADATFAHAGFRNTGTDPALTLTSAVAQDGFTFEGATFAQAVRADDVIARSFNLDGVTFEGPATISVLGANVGDLRYSLANLDRVVEDEADEQKHKVLSLVESSAKRRDEIALANDAHYKLQELHAQSYGTIRRAADAVFYRGIAGYFVRPLRPLAVLALFALAFALGRWVRKSGIHLWGPRRAWSWIVGLGEEIYETFALAIPRIGGGQQTQPLSVGRRLEVLGYRLLFICALIGLANSNPTLREMFNAFA